MKDIEGVEGEEGREGRHYSARLVKQNLHLSPPEIHGFHSQCLRSRPKIHLKETAVTEMVPARALDRVCEPSGTHL